MSTQILKYNTVTGEDFQEALKQSDIDSNLQDFIKDLIGETYLDTDSVDFTYDSIDKTLIANVKTFPGGGLETVSAGIKIKLDDLLEILRGRFGNHTDVSYYKSSVFGDTIILDHLNQIFTLHGDSSFYFRVHIEGSWGFNSLDNHNAIDYRTVPIYAQLLKCNTGGTYTKLISKRCDYISGTAINIDFEVELEQDTPVQVFLNFSPYDDSTLSDSNKPIANFDLFWMRLTITKCPKVGWFKIFDIPSSDLDGNPVKTGSLPTDVSVGLPFKGYYKCYVYVEVIEKKATGDFEKNNFLLQTLEIQGRGDVKKRIDRGGRYEPVIPTNFDQWMNRAMRGEYFVNINLPSVEDRKIDYWVTLPNGALTKLEAGYCLVQYLGKTDGLLGTLD